MRYNNFVLVKETDSILRKNGSKRRRADFKCDCGIIKNYDYSKIINGDQLKCADCSRLERKQKSIQENPEQKILYSKWCDIKNRCYNPNVERYSSYGGRGIKVCDQWKNDFKSFFKWSIENGWKPGLSIERKNVNLNYTPENCTYITMKEQTYNLRNTYYIYYQEQKFSLKKIINESELEVKVFNTIYNGIKKGKDLNYYLNKYPKLKEILDDLILRTTP